MGFEAEVVSSIEGKRCVIKAINVGRRPISLQPKPEYKYDGETATDVSGWRPESDLVEGKSAAVIINKAIDLSKLTDVVVKDVTGRSRKGKIPKTKE